MAENIYGTVGSVSPSYLLATNTETEAVAVPLKPNSGVINAGTVIYRNADGLYEAAAAANIIATNYLLVLRDTVDTADDDDFGIAAAAYRNGNFVKGKVTAASGAALTAANIIVLRAQGITFVPMYDTTAATADIPVIDNEASE